LLVDSEPQLKLTFDIEELQPESIVIKGRLVSVNGGPSDDFIIYGEANMSELVYTFERPAHIGSYGIELVLFATTKAGREITLNMPSEAFVIPKPIIIDSALIPIVTASQAATTDMMVDTSENADSDWNLLLWIVGGLITLLILVVGILLSIKFWQKRKFEKVISNKIGSDITVQAPVESNDELSMMTDLDLNTLDK
jgi:uncharacterized protein (TIGR03503 family)